jgi:hypothetical protein
MRTEKLYVMAEKMENPVELLSINVASRYLEKERAEYNLKYT